MRFVIFVAAIFVAVYVNFSSYAASGLPDAEVACRCATWLSGFSQAALVFMLCLSGTWSRA
jgi:hypothetical protein